MVPEDKVRRLTGAANGAGTDVNQTSGIPELSKTHTKPKAAKKHQPEPSSATPR